MHDGNEHGISRRQALFLAGSAAAVALTSGVRVLRAADPATAPATSPAGEPPMTATERHKRFKVAADDLFLDNRRQKVQALQIAKKAGLDGVFVDMGSLPQGKELVNKLRDEALRNEYLNTSKETGVEIAGLSWFGMYAHVFPDMPIAVDICHEWIDTMAKLNVKLGTMPLSTKDFNLHQADHPEGWKKTVEIFKQVAPEAEKAGVVLGVDSPVNADDYKRFLDAVGSPAVQAYYNPGVGLENKFDVYADLKSLGKDRVCALHLEQGSVAPENFEHRLGDGLIDFKKLRETLLDMNWGGWMSIARSRLKGTTSASTNMLANGKFVHDLFPE